ncbi:MAG: biotin transporter BioY [Spirochaetaceae bacterium]
MDTPSRARYARRIAAAAVCTALIAAGSYISVPIPWSPAPISLASMFVTLAGLLLGARRGVYACILYLSLGAAGLPVFASGSGGIAPLLGPTGGFLFGYPLSACVAGLVFRPHSRSRNESRSKLFFRALAASLAAAGILYFPGLAWLMLRLDLHFPAALAVATLPFIPGDIIKAVTAAAATRTLMAAGTLQELLYVPSAED